MTSYVLAIDQGTTSTRASLFRADTSVAAFAQQEFPQHFPADGEVEHEPEDLWTTTVACCRGAMQKAGATAHDIVAIGITNQRETTMLWDRATGRTVHRAIVWQDRRTADACARLKAAAMKPSSPPRPGCCSIRISPAQNSPGCWIARRTFAKRRHAASSRSAPSIRISCGGSPAAKCTPPTPPMRRARCCSISIKAAGTIGCWRCSACPKPFCRRCWIAPPRSA